TVGGPVLRRCGRGAGVLEGHGGRAALPQRRAGRRRRAVAADAAARGARGAAMMAAEKLGQPPLPSQPLPGLARVAPGQGVAVLGLALDSRQVRPGFLFLAVAGRHVHGVDFVADAGAAGAAAIVWEPTDAVTEDSAPLRAASIPVVAVERLS